jgi:SAM-dependent methyltransferase
MAGTEYLSKGIWLSDLAKETSTKPQYLGTDIESNFFPNASTLPPNMRFETQSILDLPKEWTNKFTLIHQRLLIAGLRRHEWEQALREMHRVLKPGGWVQVFELEKWTSGPALAKHLDLIYRFSDDIGIMYRDITKQLPNFLKRSGFVDIHQDTRSTPLGIWANQYGVDGKENVLGVLRGLKTPILRGGGYGVVQSEDEYDELLEEISKEIDMTPGSTALWTMFWARKPFE